MDSGKSPLYSPFFILLVCIAIILPSIWQEPGFIIACGDIGPPLYTVENVVKMLYIWDTVWGLGYPGYDYVGFPLWLYYAISHQFGAEYWLCQRIYLSFILMSIFASIYIFNYSLFRSTLGAFVSAFFYVFNLTMMQRVFSYHFMISSIIIPLLLYFLVKLNQKGAISIKDILKLSFTSFFLGLTFLNPPTFLVIVAFILFFAFLELLIHKFMVKIIKLVILFLLTIFFINTWWFIPVIYLTLNQQFEVTVKAPLSTSAWTMSRSTLLNIFRLNFYWSWKDPKYFSFDIKIYSTPVFVILSIIPVLIAFTSMLFRPKNNREKYYLAFFSITALISIFLQKGINPPFGELYETLYDNLPLFWLFRSPKFELILLVSLSALLGYVCSKIATIYHRSKLHSLTSTSVTILFLLIISILTYPYFTGEIVPPTYTTGSRALIKVPEYWFDAAAWLRQQQSNLPLTILVLPPNPFYQVGYTWGYYGVDSIPYLLLPGRVIIPEPPPTPYSGGYVSKSGRINATSGLYFAVKDLNISSFSYWLKTLGVDYIVVRGDYDYDLLNKRGILCSLEDLLNFLGKLENVKLKFQEGSLYIYEIVNNKGIITSIPQAIEVRYQMVNPALYYIDVKAQEQFLLIFRDTYDQGWKIYKGRKNVLELLLERPVVISSPYSEYCNGFLMNALDEEDSFTLYYEPQNILIISTITCIILTSLLIILSRHFKLIA
jgi:hypothetical protein